MCIIAVKEKNIPMFDDKTIKQMFSRNSDGAGIMWTENGNVHFKKGFMKVEPFLDFVHSRDDWSTIPAVLHFRIGTAGGNTPLNCHPYPIKKKNTVEGVCNMAMAHNGVMYKYNPPKGSSINDTQVFVNTVINDMPAGFLKSKAILKLIKEDIGTNKLAFLDKTGTITLIGDFIEDNGYKYSNSSYKVWEYPKGITNHVPYVNLFDKKQTKADDSEDDIKNLNRSFEAEEDDECIGENLLSFENKFQPCGEGTEVVHFDSIKEYNDAIEELESKAVQVDSEIFETLYDTYELDDGAIYRYTNEWCY